MIKFLLKEYNHFEFNISYTMREPRDNEKYGVDYFFISKEKFQQEIENENFLEYASVHKNLYGTHRQHVHNIVTSGKVINKIFFQDLCFRY